MRELAYIYTAIGLGPLYFETRCVKRFFSSTRKQLDFHSTLLNAPPSLLTGGLINHQVSTSRNIILEIECWLPACAVGGFTDKTLRPFRGRESPEINKTG